jgi:peptidoglycan/LPS O-acetylase OafA/YrhL
MVRPAKVEHHVKTLDGIRGLAILLVMIHHLFVLTPQNRIENAFASVAHLGAHGVDLFFVLSGFLITGILLAGRGESHQLRNFYARRVLRIFPLYYAVLAFSFLILPTLMRALPLAASKLARFEGTTQEWYWYVLYLSNFAIAHAGAFRHGVLDVTWSLAIEEQFYLLWPAIVLLLNRRQLEFVCLGIIVAALLCRIAVYATGYTWIQAYVLTPCRMDALAVGGLLAAHVRSGHWNQRALVVASKRFFAIAMLLIASAVGMGYAQDYSPLVYTIGFSVIAMVCGAGLLIVRYSPPGSLINRIFSSKLLTIYGRYSYGIYLFHLPIRAAIRDLAFGDSQFRKLPGSPLLWQAAFYLIGCAAVLPPAVLSYHLFEKRFLNLKRYFPSASAVR